MKNAILIIFTILIVACTPIVTDEPVNEIIDEENSEMTGLNDEMREAYFAGGCFWCVEADFEKADGIIEGISGFAGGNIENPTYKQVSSGTTGHLETVKVIYNPNIISYKELLDILWRHIDPTDPDGSFVDRGEQYTSGIFYLRGKGNC